MTAPWPPSLPKPLKVPEAPTLAEIRRAPVLPLVVLGMALGLGCEQGPAFGALAGLAYGGLWLYRRPPGAVSLFVGAEAAWSLARIVFAAMGEGAPGALREAGGLILLAMVIALRPVVRGRKPFASLLDRILPSASRLFSLVAFAVSLGFARRDGWPAVAVLVLIAIFLGAHWPHSERVRSVAIGTFGMVFGLVVFLSITPGAAFRLAPAPLFPTIFALALSFGAWPVPSTDSSPATGPLAPKAKV